MFKSLLTEWHEIGWTDIPASAKSEKDSTYPIEAMHFKIKWDNTYEVPNMMPGTQICLTKIVNMGLPGSPVVKIPWALGSKFLVKKLRSHMLHGVAKKKKKWLHYYGCYWTFGGHSHTIKRGTHVMIWMFLLSLSWPLCYICLWKTLSHRCEEEDGGREKTRVSWPQMNAGGWRLRHWRDLIPTQPFSV